MLRFVPSLFLLCLFFLSCKKTFNDDLNITGFEKDTIIFGENLVVYGNNFPVEDKKNFEVYIYNFEVGFVPVKIDSMTSSKIEIFGDIETVPGSYYVVLKYFSKEITSLKIFNMVWKRPILKSLSETEANSSQKIVVKGSYFSPRAVYNIVTLKKSDNSFSLPCTVISSSIDSMVVRLPERINGGNFYLHLQTFGLKATDSISLKLNDISFDSFGADDYLLTDTLRANFTGLSGENIQVQVIESNHSKIIDLKNFVYVSPELTFKLDTSLGFTVGTYFIKIFREGIEVVSTESNFNIKNIKITSVSTQSLKFSEQFTIFGLFNSNSRCYVTHGNYGKVELAPPTNVSNKSLTLFLPDEIYTGVYSLVCSDSFTSSTLEPYLVVNGPQITYVDKEIILTHDSLTIHGAGFEPTITVFLVNSVGEKEEQTVRSATREKIVIEIGQLRNTIYKLLVKSSKKGTILSTFYISVENPTISSSDKYEIHPSDTFQIKGTHFSSTIPTQIYLQSSTDPTKNFLLESDNVSSVLFKCVVDKNNIPDTIGTYKIKLKQGNYSTLSDFSVTFKNP